MKQPVQLEFSRILIVITGNIPNFQITSSFLQLLSKYIKVLHYSFFVFILTLQRYCLKIKLENFSTIPWELHFCLCFYICDIQYMYLLYRLLCNNKFFMTTHKNSGNIYAHKKRICFYDPMDSRKIFQITSKSLYTI